MLLIKLWSKSSQLESALNFGKNYCNWRFYSIEIIWFLIDAIRCAFIDIIKVKIIAIKVCVEL